MTTGEPRSRGVPLALAAALTTPMVGLAVLLAVPDLDGHWYHQPSHFWLVLAAGGLAAALSWAVGTAARRRSDARLLLVSIAFLSAAGFLALHALATPGVLLDGPNTGFTVATPVGLLLASGFAAWSALPLDGARSRWVMGHAPVLRGAVLAVVALWAVWSLASLPPLDTDPPASQSPALVAIGLPGTILFLAAAIRYLGLARDRRSGLLLAVSAAWILLGESMVAVALGRAWRASWWLWHVLMLIAFGAIAYVARRLPDNERFSDLYLDEVKAGTREVSVLFADLEGFTSWSERHGPEEIQAMLNAYYEAVLPAVRAEDGRLDRFIGDAVMVTFNVSAEQPDHPARAARAALGYQEAAATVAAEHPEWPRFRVGVNTGVAAVGVVGDAAERDYTVLGDTVNVAARLEGLAPAGAVAVGDATRRALQRDHIVRVASLGTVSVKGREEPVEVWRLEGLEEIGSAGLARD